MYGDIYIMYNLPQFKKKIFLAILGFDIRALHLPSKHPNMWTMPTAHHLKFFKDKVVAWIHLHNTNVKDKAPGRGERLSAFWVYLTEQDHRQGSQWQITILELSSYFTLKLQNKKWPTNWSKYTT
jgi:hypothetical protein